MNEEPALTIHATFVRGFFREWPFAKCPEPVIDAYIRYHWLSKFPTRMVLDRLVREGELEETNGYYSLKVDDGDLQ